MSGSEKSGIKNRKDNFSLQADLYAKYRPHYPAELYSYLYSKVPHFNVAWDCGTGNGQVAYQLASRFEKVFATDISQRQIDKAPKSENIDYLIAPAAETPLSATTVDLITVAQALHWFEPNLFYKEVQRVGKPGALLAYWGYNLPHINKSIDSLVKDFHDNVVGPYWDPERKFLLDEYANISFPLSTPQYRKFTITVSWNLNQLTGYLNSWSSVQQYIKENKENPVGKLKIKLKKEWIDNQYISFPVFMTLGYIS